MSGRQANRIPAWARGLAALLLVLALTALVGGCVSADQDSDLPWNAAQPWETAPAGYSNLGSRM